MEEEVMPIQRPKSFIPDEDEESQTEELSSPQSFIADEEEEHKPGIFSKIKDALTPAEKIHPGEGPKAKLDRFLGSVLQDKDSNIGRMLRSQNPASEPILPPIKKEPDTWGGGFLKGLYDEFVRPLTSAEGIAGIIGMGKGSPFHGGETSKIKGLSVRQPSREIPYKVAGDLPSNMTERELSVRQPASLPPDMVLPEEQDIFNKARSERVNKVFEGESPRYTQEDLAKAKIENERLSQTPAGKREKFVSPFDKQPNIEESKPTATYIGEQEGVGSLFNIEGGADNRSTVTAKGLKDRGIKIPEYEKSAAGESPEYAQAVADEAPIVPIKKELPRVSPENEADLELWYKYKKLYDTGKMNDQQMTEWAEVHNKVKDLKGSAVLRPHRFETLPEEPPEFTNYILPDGQKVKLSTSATKGAEKTTFQMKGGKVVEAIREDIHVPEAKTLTIENAPPNQRAKMMRGAHEPVDILFNDSNDRELFGAGQRGLSKGMIKPGWADRFKEATNNVVKKYGVSEQEARTAISNYNVEIRKLGSVVDREGGNITAPSFESFLKGGEFEDALRERLGISDEKWDQLHSELKQELRDKTGGPLTVKKINDLNQIPKSEEITKVTNSITKLDPDAKIQYSKNNDGIAISSSLGATNENYGRGIVEQKLIHVPGINDKFPASGVDSTGKWFILAKDKDAFNRLIDELPDDITELHGGLGGINPSKRALSPSSGPYAQALDKLFSSLGKTAENRVQQDIINKTERARRFAASAGVEDVGVKGASKSLSALKGEFEKVDVDKLKMTQPQVDSLFTAVKKAKITEGEKARGYTALFKLMNGDGVPQRSELAILDDVFGNDFASKITELHGGLGAVGMNVSKVANTMKAMMSSIDLSFPLKQGIGFAGRAEWRNAVVEQLKYFAKPEYYDAAMQAIESRPKYILGRESGLFLAKHGSLTHGEEAFAHNYLGSLPKMVRAPFDASERAYTGGLNKLRSDLFDNLTELAEKAGNKVKIVTDVIDTSDKELVTALKKKAREMGISEADNTLDNPELIKLAKEAGMTKEVHTPTKIAENIANYINVFTGRGKLGRLEPIANELNTVFWSPRLLSSRLTALNPKFYYDLDPFTRKEAIKSLFSIAAASSLINGLGAAAGAKVGYNILSSDFAKSRFKDNNVLDPSGGFQQPIVAAARMIEELNRMRTGGKQQFNKPGIPGIVGNFLVNKLSSLAGLAYDIASAKNFGGKTKDESLISGRGPYVDRFGNKKNILDETGKRFVSMFIQDVYDIVNSDPSFAETVGLLPLIALGAGEQNYPEKKDKKKSLFMKKLK